MKGSQIDASVKSVKSSKKGRKKIPEQWSRVICFDDIEHYEVKGFKLEPDLQDIQNNPMKP